MLFDEIGLVLYACMVAKLSQHKYEEVYEFLKLVMEGARVVKTCNKKGFERAGRIEQCLKESKG